MARADSIGFVLFDLGGVLIDPGGVEPMRRLSGLGSDEDVWARWLACRWVRRFESGACSSEEFAAGLVADWELDLAPDEFLRAFGDWPGDPYPGALELVDDVRQTAQVGCLSNTNAFQWRAHFHGTPLTDAFEYSFLSFELGMVKPDVETFQAVAARLPTDAGRVLFLDDNAVNVESATSVGFHSRHVRGVDEARRALVEADVLAD